MKRKEIRLEQHPNTSFDATHVASYKTAEAFKEAHRPLSFTDLIPEEQDAALEEVYQRATAGHTDKKDAPKGKESKAHKS